MKVHVSKKKRKEKINLFSVPLYCYDLRWKLATCERYKDWSLILVCVCKELSSLQCDIYYRHTKHNLTENRRN